jgi:hypothetical protein
MAGDQSVSRQLCTHEGCIGVRLASAVWCLAHVAEQDPAALDAELKRICIEGTVNARGVRLSNGLLNRLLDAAPQENGRPILNTARFDGATFVDDAVFDGVTFRGDAGFDRTIFQGDARFERATLPGPWPRSSPIKACGRSRWLD